MTVPAMLLLAAICVSSFALAFYGAAVGLILGHLRLPLLLYYPPTAAAGQAYNLAVSGMGALTGVVGHVRAGRISWRAFVLMGVPSALGAVLGAVLLVKVPREWANVFVGVFLAVSGLNLLVAKPEEGSPALFGRRTRALLEFVIGLGLGFLGAVTGLMMGSMRLPMMLKWLKIDPAVAVGTNMALGLLTAVAGTAAYLAKGGTFDPMTLLVVAPPTVVGGWLGARWTGRFKKETLTKMVGWAVGLTGVYMVGQGAWEAAGKAYPG